MHLPSPSSSAHPSRGSHQAPEASGAAGFAPSGPGPQPTPAGRNRSAPRRGRQPRLGRGSAAGVGRTQVEHDGHGGHGGGWDPAVEPGPSPLRGQEPGFAKLLQVAGEGRPRDADIHGVAHETPRLPREATLENSHSRTGPESALGIAAIRRASGTDNSPAVMGGPHRSLQVEKRRTCAHSLGPHRPDAPGRGREPRASRRAPGGTGPGLRALATGADHSHSLMAAMRTVASWRTAGLSWSVARGNRAASWGG